MAKKVLTYNLSEPLNSAAAAKIDINAGDGNMVIDGITNGEPVLANGTLQYLENQAAPIRSADTLGSQVTLTLKSGGKGQPWLRLPWSTCNGATEWQVHLNPNVSYDLTAHTDGGNVRIDLAGMAITHLMADTGGGNMDVVLPDSVTGKITVKSGAGNVTVSLPNGIAARINATSGLGKVIMDAGFDRIDKNTYQSSGYDSASTKVEITLSSGAGNVTAKVRVGEPEPATSLI